MKEMVISALSDFLGADEYQVEEWDSHAVEGLAGNTGLFQAFQSGGELTKWCIYASFKHPQTTRMTSSLPG